MKWREKLGMFVLTREEQRTIAFIILALVLGLGTMHYRQAHRREAPNDKQKVAATPSPIDSR